MKKLILVLFLGISTFALSACAENQSFEKIKKRLSALIPEETTGDLNLPASDSSGALVSWSSSNPLVISEEGTLLEPEVQTIITLTANVKYKSATEIFDFTTKVGTNVEYPIHDQIYDDIKLKLGPVFTANFTNINNIKDNRYGSTIKITSSDQNIMNNSGVINKKTHEQPFTLYVSITYKNVEKITEKSVSVAALGGTDIMSTLQELVMNELNDLALGKKTQLRTYFPEVDKTIKYFSSEIGFITPLGKVSPILHDGDVTVRGYYIQPGLIKMITYEKVFKNPYVTTNKTEFAQNFLTEFYKNKTYISDFNTKTTAIVEDLLPVNPVHTRTGTLMDVKYIIIHETGNKTSTAGADTHNSFIKGKPLSDIISWHITVDDKKIIRHIPINEKANHNMDNQDPLNGVTNNGIGIEHCVNEGGNFEVTKIRGAKLVANMIVDLRENYGFNLKLTDIRQHNEFSNYGKDCPAEIRADNAWAEYLELCAYELFKLEYPEFVVNFEQSLIKTTFNDSIYQLKSPLTFSLTSK